MTVNSITMHATYPADMTTPIKQAIRPFKRMVIAKSTVEPNMTAISAGLIEVLSYTPSVDYQMMPMQSVRRKMLLPTVWAIMIPMCPL